MKMVDAYFPSLVCVVCGKRSILLLRPELNYHCSTACVAFGLRHKVK